jgi:6-phosphofructokinase 2
MVAGIVYRLSAGSSLKEALQYGVACGTAATITPGSELCRKSDVERLFRIISNGTPESLSQVMPKN